jgi:hypothetical protein
MRCGSRCAAVVVPNPAAFFFASSCPILPCPQQFRYFVLDETLVPSITLGLAPSYDDLSSAYQTLSEAYITAKDNQAKRVNEKVGWVYIEVPIEKEPYSIASLQQNGTATVNLPIPLLNYTDPATNETKLKADTTYYDVRMLDVGAYLLSAPNTPLVSSTGHTIGASLSKGGSSSFFNSTFGLVEFTHSEQEYSSFRYDSSTGCPTTGAVCSESALCPDYIQYSPFGTWHVAFPSVFEPQSGLNMSQVHSIRFEFHVTFRGGPNEHDPNERIFGKGYPLGTYPQDWKTLCSNPHQRRE